MKKIVFVVERTSDGYSAYAENFPVYTTGSNIAEIKSNALEAMNLYCEEKALRRISLESISIKLDLPQFFDFYKEINAKALSHRIHMNESLLSQYIDGKKEPSEKQVQRILMGIKELGKELTELDLAF